MANASKIYTAVHTLAEFMSKKSIEFQNTYNPNPSFFQRAVDEDRVVEQPSDFPSSGLLSVPWPTEGFVYFEDDIVCIIDIEWDNYCTLTFDHPVATMEALNEKMNAIIEVLEAGYRAGYESGQADKCKEIKMALSL